MKTAITLSISPDINIEKLIDDITFIDHSLISRNYFVEILTLCWKDNAKYTADFRRDWGRLFFYTNLITRILFNFELVFTQDGDKTAFTINDNVFYTQHRNGNIDIMTRKYFAECFIEFSAAIDSQAKENKYLRYTINELKKFSFSDIEIDYMKEDICIVCDLFANFFLDGTINKKDIIDNIKKTYKFKYNKG